MTDIKKYVSRYVVPFYFDYENDGYANILNHFRTYDEASYGEKGLPNGSKWVQKDFWEKYKSDNSKISEMDIYTHLLRIFKEYPDEDVKSNTNLGCSFVLATNGVLLKMMYKDTSNGSRIDFKCVDLGILTFRNGIGFIWYDIEFSRVPNVQDYVKFQHDFKELTKTHSDKFVKKTGKDSADAFCMGLWLCDIIDSEKLKISFWTDRKTKISVVEGGITNEIEIRIPDKAMLFQYLYVNEMNEDIRMELAFKIANGYDEKYLSPKTLGKDIYEPFGNTGVYISKTGMSYVASYSELNKAFFMESFCGKFKRDYFFIYILLLYQTYSCAHYSRLFAKLPAEKQYFEKRGHNKNQYYEVLESLSNQVNLFLVKGIYESVSNIQHQNGVYRYGKNILSIEGDVKSLTMGLDSLKVIEKDKRNQKYDTLMKILGVFGVVSVVNDLVGFIDLIVRNEFGVIHGIGFCVVFLGLIIWGVITKCKRRR